MTPARAKRPPRPRSQSLPLVFVFVIFYHVLVLVLVLKKSLRPLRSAIAKTTQRMCQS